MNSLRLGSSVREIVTSNDIVYSYDENWNLPTLEMQNN